MTTEISQPHLTLAILASARRKIIWLVLLALATGAPLGLAARTAYQPSYETEMVLLCETPPKPQEALGHISMDANVVYPPRPLSGYLDPPLPVEDIALLLESSPMLAEVAKRMPDPASLGVPGPTKPLTYEAIGRMVTATARVELKTPYEVKYFPGILLKVKASTPELSHGLMKVWMEVAKERLAAMAFSARLSEALIQAEIERKIRLDRIAALRDTLFTLKQEHAQKMTANTSACDDAIIALLSAKPEDFETKKQEVITQSESWRKAIDDELVRESAAIQLNMEDELAQLRALTESLPPAMTMAAASATGYDFFCDPAMPNPKDKPAQWMFIAGGVMVLAVGLAILLLAWEAMRLALPGEDTPAAKKKK